MKKTHGHSRRTRAYSCWATMLRRCRNPNVIQYPYYGGRGIQVCERWRRFENFLADMGEPPNGMTLDRIDVNGHYELANCRWANATAQRRNRRDRKLNEEKAAEIRASKERTAVLASKYSVSTVTIQKVRAGKFWAPDLANVVSEN